MRVASMKRTWPQYGAAARMMGLKRSTWPTCRTAPRLRGQRHQFFGFLDRLGQRLLDQAGNAALQKEAAHFMVIGRGHHDGDGIHAAFELPVVA